MARNSIKRLAIVPGDLGAFPLPALEYLVLKLNTLQSDVEFEFLPLDKDFPFLNTLNAKAVLSMADFRREAPKCVRALDVFLEQTCGEYGLRVELPDRYVFLTLASLDTRWYEFWERRYSAVFLGEWEDTMAPPSLLEFMLTMVMLEGLTSIINLNVHHISHLSTRGCIADFNSTIRDVRYKTLQGFLCRECLAILKKKIGQDRSSNWIRILGKEWIGQPSDPLSPASIVDKLGYNLFLTKGLSPTLWQRFLRSLQEDGAKELIKMVALLVGAALLAWLGFKK